MYSPTADIFKWRLDEKSGLIIKAMHYLQN
jgi:hypothetical protein